MPPPPPSSSKPKSATVDMFDDEYTPLLQKLPPRPITPDSTFSVPASYISLRDEPPTPKRWKTVVTLTTALTLTLSAGSILIFSLFTPSLLSAPHYFTQLQINSIASAAEIGMYLPVPLFGLICDRYGPSRLSLLSALFFATGYAVAATVYERQGGYELMMGGFGLVGSGTSAMYFAGVTTCAKTVRGRRGIALAAPIAGFGLSGAGMAGIVSRFFTDDAGDIGVGRVWWFFSGALGVVGLLGSVGLQWCPRGDEEDEDKPFDESDEKGWLNADTRAFLKDRTMWWFALGVFLVTGPGEAFINNMGTLITTLPKIGAPVEATTHVSLIALTSTLARLFAGSLSDYLAPPSPTLPPSPPRSRPSLSRVPLLLFFAALMMGGFLLISSGYIYTVPESFYLVSSSVGAGYGAVFCLAPTVVSVVWGTRNFGTNWGIITVTPAVGATLFGSLFAGEFDGHVSDGKCIGSECSRWSFAVMAGSVGVAMLGWIWAWRGRGGWKSRGVVV